MTKRWRKKKQEPDNSEEMGVFMISVAAQLAGMHPQTLRVYEQRGLVKPKRSPKKTRLYSQRDVEQLRKIQELTGEMGMNLAGVERVFEMETLIGEMESRLARARSDLDELQLRMDEEIEAVRRSYRRELVLYEPSTTEVVRRADFDTPSFQIPIERKGH